ncbi:MAG: HAD family phosphatase [Myxococcota bacterium]
MTIEPRRPVLLFDIMSTVVYDPIWKEIPGFFGLELREFFRAVKPNAWVEFELGRLNESETMAEFFIDGRSFDTQAFKHTIREAYRFIDDEMEPLLQRLKSAGFAMHALSNYPPWYSMIEERLALSRYLEWTFVSCNLGVRKPDPQIYTRACDHLGIAPGDALFIDDREDNCEGALAVGLDAIRFESTATLAQALEARGVPA